MSTYVLRRLLLIIPTLAGIMLLNFIIVQFAPGGPVDQAVASLKQGAALHDQGTFGGNVDNVSSPANASMQRGIPPEIMAQIKAQYGFDKPPAERFFLMIKNYTLFDFGDSFYRDSSVVNLIIEKLPVSISLGLWSTLLIYLISIPLGIKKALRHNSAFDVWTSSIIVVGYAVPGFLFAMILVVVFAGGSYLDWFPLRGLTSDNFDELGLGAKIVDYFWHLALPITAYTLGGFATLTLLTKNSFLDEINKQYVTTAVAKGLDNKQVLYGHVFRNAMLIIIAGFPSAFVSMFFTGSLLIEVIFSLDGIGLLTYEAVVNRDYPIVFSTLYIFTLMSLLLKLLSDLVYHWVDPRITFEGGR
ncbi:MAG TPA: microcin C ABC transporter permease YejB [Marinagarivorans sp.]